jgi:hypothetical protein
MPRWVAQIGVIWGVAGIVAILVRALLQLIPIALEPFETGLPAWQWGLYGLVVVGMAYCEGYRGFQKSFSPRSIARAFSLLDSATATRIILAPLFAMGFVGATKRRVISVSVLTLVIVAAVVSVRYLPQPYRSIVDGGVVVGLGWGLLSLLAFTAKALAGSVPAVALDLPAPPGSEDA